MKKGHNYFRLDRKVALITGGGSGIGLGIAEQFVALGATVVITGRTEDRLEKAVATLGEAAHHVVNDITDKPGHGPLIEYVENEIGPISILVNNAGKHLKKMSVETTVEEFQAVMDTNLNSVFSLTNAVLKYMIPRGQGSVINISSMAALYGIPKVVAYSSSKTALLGLTRTLATEYSDVGIRFNTIAPGFIESEMLNKAMDQDPERKQKVLSRTPANRFGSPADIGRAAAFLASDASQYITGVCLPVDGGNSIGF